MKPFSERKGITKPRTEIQVDSMDDALRNRLWSAVSRAYLDDLHTIRWDALGVFISKFWDNYLKLPLDTAPSPSGKQILRDYFFSFNWYNVYDFLELLVTYYPNKQTNEFFINACNSILESELSAYRFVGGQITQITSKEEIAEIEEALDVPFRIVNAHLENALKLMSDRKSPDYRNSIKESISAVEGICRLITKNDNATLGQALKEVETKVGLHGALKSAFSNLYGYTSSAEGIRHALLDEAKLNFEDAKFMLVSCSAFVNYLVSKASKAGLSIGQTKS